MASKQKVGIIGLGKVGTVVLRVLEFWHDCVGYDLGDGYEWSEILKTDSVLVCVPTPEGADNHLDCSAVDVTLQRLSDDGYPGLIIIKSTLRVGYMDVASKKHPKLRLVYMPEFLRERSNLQWFTNPDRIVVSGTDEDIAASLKIFSWVEEAPILRMSHLDAEIGKLAHNAYIATKVSFTNEIESICNEHGADPTNVMSVIWADRRVVSREHLTPLLGPYAGKCVSKDTRELINSSDNATLLQAVEEVNRKVAQKTNLDSEKRM